MTGTGMTYLDVLLQVLRPLESLATKVTLVRLQRDVNANVRSDVVTLDGGGSALIPTAGQVQVVGALTADMLVTDVVLRELATAAEVCRRVKEAADARSAPRGSIARESGPPAVVVAPPAHPAHADATRPSHAAARPKQWLVVATPSNLQKEPRHSYSALHTCPCPSPIGRRGCRRLARRAAGAAPRRARPPTAAAAGLATWW